MYESRNNLHERRGLSRYVTRADLARSVRLLGNGYAFDDGVTDENEAVLHGRFETLNLRPGLILHAAAVRDMLDANTVNMLNPGLKIVLVVKGATDISFGHHRFHLGPLAATPEARVRGALVNLSEVDSFSRRWRRGRYENKVSLTLTREWLDMVGWHEQAGLSRFLDTHLASHPWEISVRARELARQILEPASFASGLQRLRLESRCIELASEALASLATPRDGTRAYPEATRRLLARLEELLVSDAVLGMGTADIAQAVGSNPTSLQALARRAWGCSLFERLRAIRMEKAHAALAGGGSVGEAAGIAGYASATNFSTAFRREYGFSPRQAKRRP